MPLRFDPAALMAPGGVVSGLDNMGAAVMNALNRRAERKYALDREKTGRNYKWWHDAASTGPDEMPAYSGLEPDEIVKLEAIRNGVLGGRRAAWERAQAMIQSRIKPEPPPPVIAGAPTTQTKTVVDKGTGEVRQLQTPIRIAQSVEIVKDRAAKAAQSKQPGLAQALNEQASAGEYAAAVLGDPDPLLGKHRKAAADALSAAEIKLPGAARAVQESSVENIDTALADDKAARDRHRRARAAAAALAEQSYMDSPGLISPFSPWTEELQIAGINTAQDDLELLTKGRPLTPEEQAADADPEGAGSAPVSMTAAAAADALAGDGVAAPLPSPTFYAAQGNYTPELERLLQADPGADPEAEAAAARVADIRARLEAAQIDHASFTDEQLLAQYGMIDQE
jgi:hypothetical protein